jgi:hypothetical protein
MFDLITGTGERPVRERSFTSKVMAIATHVVVVTVVIAIPLLRVTNQLPELPAGSWAASCRPRPAVALLAAGVERHPSVVRADGHLQLQREENSGHHDRREA